MLINREFLVTALPAVLVTFAFSFLLKTKSRKEAVRRGMVWTGVFVLMYILIGIGNHNLDLMFGTAGVYVLLACVFSGPVFYSAMLRLLPFSYREALRGDGSLTPDDYMLAGGYPRLYDTRMPLGTFFENYVSTYLERDVAGFLDVRNLSTFRTFLGLCARNCGGLLRYVTLEQGAQVAHGERGRAGRRGGSDRGRTAPPVSDGCQGRGCRSERPRHR